MICLIVTEFENYLMPIYIDKRNPITYQPTVCATASENHKLYAASEVPSENYISFLKLIITVDKVTFYCS